MPRNIVITGASKGIGRALAVRYAREQARLGLVARDRSQLDAVAAECRELGAEVSVGAIDVLDRASLARWLEAFDRASPVDLVFANAGILGGATVDRPVEPVHAARAIIEVNMIGALNTIEPLLAPMLARRRGSIALMSSIAAFDPTPEMPGYGASKSALLSYGLALRTAVRPYGVWVSVVCPGYVDTPMTDQISGSTPFKMSAAKSADLIYRGLGRRKAVVAFPFFFALVARLAGFLPFGLRRRRMRLTISPQQDPTNR